MNTTTFNPLKLVKTLEQANPSHEQAVRDAYLGIDAATKVGLDDLEARIDSKFDMLYLLCKEVETMRKGIIIKKGVMLTNPVLSGVKLL